MPLIPEMFISGASADKICRINPEFHFWGERPVSVTYAVEADWDRLTAVAVVRPEFFALTAPINLTQHRFYGTADQPSTASIIAQHERVVQVLANQGIHVVRVAPTSGLPLQFNVRDAAIVIGSRLVLARMARRERAGEPALVVAALAPTSAVAVSGGTLEGGDLMLTPTEIFVGLGERTNEAGCKSLSALLAQGRRVTAIRLTKGTLHLDVALNLLGPHIGVIHRPSIANDLPESLRTVEWIEVTDDEFAEQAVNMLVVEPRTVIMDARHERLRSNLTTRGWRCLPVELDEITKVGGGVRCMTLPLVRVHAQDAFNRRYGT
jgi:N-dimethylarginine dimethylaminohydrolase